eukprot:s373_g1.t1
MSGKRAAKLEKRSGHVCFKSGQVLNSFRREAALTVPFVPEPFWWMRSPRPNSGYAFDPTYAVTAQSGRGGNFALGYTGELAGRASTLDGSTEQLWAQAMQVMRMQAEGCHGAHLGTLMTYSLGGGTGSGLGSRLLEEVRDLYPKIPLLATLP